MALNFNPELVPGRLPATKGSIVSTDEQNKHLDWSLLQTNQRAIARHLDFDHYVRSLAPGDMVLEGTAAVAIATGSRWSVLVFPDAATSSAYYTFLRPSEWLNGKIAVSVWYSATINSTNNFMQLTQVGVCKAGEVTSGTTLILNSSRALAGPAALGTLIKAATLYTTANVTRDMELIGVRVGRVGADAGDTHANDLHVYAVRVEHIPASQEGT